jgi:histidinol phosphatase-like enzyme
MMTKQYDSLQEYENQYQIAIDFDGVIYKNSKGYHDGSIYDEPLEGALDTIKYFHSQGYTMVIFTGKVKPDRPSPNEKTMIQLVEEWLEKYQVKQYIKEVTSEKPRALIYIDDKGYRFTNWASTLDFFNKEFNLTES